MLASWRLVVAAALLVSFASCAVAQTSPSWGTLTNDPRDAHYLAGYLTFAEGATGIAWDPEAASDPEYATPATFPAELQAVLFGNHTTNDTIQWSNIVSVYVETGSYFVFRISDGPNGPLFQIPTSQVHAINWIDRFET